MATPKRLFEVFEHVTGIRPTNSEPVVSSNWTPIAIIEFMDTIGQTSQTMHGQDSGISNGDFGRVKFKVQNNTLYMDFQTPEIAHLAINRLSDALGNPYEFSSRFDQMPNTIMVQFTDSGINEGDLEYAHVNDAGPEKDTFQIGTEVVPDTLAEDNTYGYDEQGKPIYISGYEDVKNLSPNDQAKLIAKLTQAKANNNISPVGEDILNIWNKYHPQQNVPNALPEGLRPGVIEKRAKDLVIGDVLTGSGGVVIMNPVLENHPMYGKNKIRIGIKYPNGKEKYPVWGKDTTIGVKAPIAPSSTTPSPSPEIPPTTDPNLG